MKLIGAFIIIFALNRYLINIVYGYFSALINAFAALLYERTQSLSYEM